MRGPPGYHRRVQLALPGSKHVPATLLRHVLTIAFVLLACRSARAAVVTLDGVNAPIIRITLRSGDVTIRTWDRASVEIDGEPALSIVRRTIRQPIEQNPVLIPHAAQRSRNGSVSLPAESFVVSTIPAGPRDAVIVKSVADTPAGPVVVTVPNDSAYVFAYARDGNLDIRDYRSGTLVAFTTHGRLALTNVGGTVFAQTLRGALGVTNSSIERMRARSLFGNITFDRCRTRQIEATSVDGSIVYDNGSFEPGLAHFESSRGDVAIGAQGAAQLGGHVAGEGRVYTNFERGAHISGTRENAQALVGGGGPVVTATTQNGNVFLYDGTIGTRGRLPAAWRTPLETMNQHTIRHDEAPHPAVLAPALPQPRAITTPRPFALPFETPRPASTRRRPEQRPHAPYADPR